jgi:iron complex outermembrane receptor protein
MHEVAKTPHSIEMHLLAAAIILVATPVLGQEGPESEDDAELQEIVVTGSRIPRDEFTSPGPLQMLDIEENRKIGVSSIPQLLYRSPVVTGAQIDATLNTAASTSNATEESPPGGVGSSSISLRGLAPERTLILVNNRRLGSVGVRGAPAQPDISMIPFDMVERVDILTGGVSAVYGADAVAGVVNVILREQIEGLHLTAHASRPADPGGQITQLSLTAGASSDRASMTFGAEYYDRERIRTADRSFTPCLRDIQLVDTGELLSPCRSNFPDNFIFSGSFIDPNTGGPLRFAFYMPDGSTDIGIPNFASWRLAVPDPTVAVPGANNFGFGNFTLFDAYNDQDERRAADLVGELERFSVVATGNYALDWWANEEAYVEAYYTNSQVFSIATTEQIFPVIAGEIAQENAQGNLVVDANGVPVFVPNPMNPFGVTVQPVLTLDSIPQTRDVEREQIRLVAGFRGEFGDSSWAYDGYVSYDRGIGFQAQPILFENHLILATQTLRLDADGNVICGPLNTTTAFSQFDTPDPCVPLNMFVDDIYTGGPAGEGVLSQAELDYLVGNRTNRTVVEQTVLNAYATGDLFDIGDRAIGAAVGFEYRRDAIDSQNDITGVLGLNAAENPLQEGQTVGERDLFEVFGEISLPLLDNLDIDAALRYTDEENFGSETTWRGGILWSPLDYLTLSASAGTSFRAPNLREQFLADQGGGVAGTLDVCRNDNIQNQQLLVPQDDPDLQFLISNCVAQGVSFIDADGDGNLDTSDILFGGTINTSAGGNKALLPETSESLTATIQFDQPWSDRFALQVAVSYWDIEIQNTVEELAAETIIGRCYTNRDFAVGESPFCGRQNRLVRADGSIGQIGFADISFINTGEQTARGIDLNTRLGYTFDRWGLDLVWATVLARLLEQEVEILDASDRDDNLGEISSPEIRFSSRLSLLFRNLEFMMENRYIGDGQQDNSDPFAPNGLYMSEPLTKPVDFVDAVWYTDLSFTYAHETWSATLGVNNLFDEEPPIISRNSGPHRNNAVTSSGYDLFGRRVFLTGSIGF